MHSHGLHPAYRFYPVAIAALLAAGSVWLEHLTRAPESAAAAAESRMPDFVADKVRISGFSHDGALRYTLDSTRLTHLPHNGITVAEQPRLQLFTQTQRMRIDADRGEVAPGGERVDLSGNVEARHESGPGDTAMRFSSDRLTVWPDTQRAASNAPVRLTRGNAHATANGIEADNLFGNIKLSGEVRMTFPRRQRNS
ncbi:MAG: LPS export ABC transporter periplasmic protein LptC [Azoarcus sp.]|jgi:lipopolysaccharide export system protein LptC|nr:LPS export ABC transporter periplasmic protein LptC [Azoarcus sp.]